MNTPNSPAPQAITVMPVTVIPSKEPPDWRDFRSLSAHPDGEDIFFVECHKDLPEICRVLRFHLKTRALAYFVLPAGYSYPEAYVSPSGKKLAIVRVAHEFKVLPKNLEQREIAVMNTDGSAFEVLPLASGPKSHPTFNATDDRIAYWRAEMRKPGSKTTTTGYDVYEYDFKTGKEAAFEPSYRFFQGGTIHYLPGGDEVLVSSDWPHSKEGRLGMDIQGYIKRYSNQIFLLKRGQSNWVEPLFAHESFEGARTLALSREGAMVFEATPPKIGSTSIYRHKADGSFLKWSKGRVKAPLGTCSAQLHS